MRLSAWFNPVLLDHRIFDWHRMFMMEEDLVSRLKTQAEYVTKALERALDDSVREGEIARPERLLAAMRHGVLNGGKRVRPFLVIESAALFCVSQEQALPAAMSLECLHSYSLVHDDLPDMDDDDLRRGKPTVHKAYDPATAILAGDGLLTLAFQMLASEDCHPKAEVRSELVLLLSRAAGLGGMVGGQMLDLAAENETLGEAAITTMQAMKTGALLCYACEAGAVLGGASLNERRHLVEYGKLIGRAFQLADDILDVTATTAELGKTAAKDIEADKETLVSLYGDEKARKIALELADQAKAELAVFGDKAGRLKDMADFIVSRQN